jgi:hypothetical protein
MKRDPKTRAAEENTLRRYLLGALSEPELTCVEEQIFTEENCYQLLCLLEDELIDAYVDERLASVERAQFEEQFRASSRQRARVEFARVFHDSLARTPPCWRTASAGS